MFALKSKGALRRVLTGASDRLAVIYFWGQGCQPCRATGPILDKIAKDADAGGLRYFAFDSDLDEGCEELVRVCLKRIRGLPTVCVYKTGAKPEEVKRLVGSGSEASFREFFVGARSE